MSPLSAAEVEMASTWQDGHRGSLSAAGFIENHRRTSRPSRNGGSLFGSRNRLSYNAGLADISVKACGVIKAAALLLASLRPSPMKSSGLRASWRRPAPIGHRRAWRIKAKWPSNRRQGKQAAASCMWHDARRMSSALRQRGTRICLAAA